MREELPRGERKEEKSLKGSRKEAGVEFLQRFALESLLSEVLEGINKLWRGQIRLGQEVRKAPTPQSFVGLTAKALESGAQETRGQEKIRSRPRSAFQAVRPVEDMPMSVKLLDRTCKNPYARR